MAQHELRKSLHRDVTLLEIIHEFQIFDQNEWKQFYVDFYEVFH